MITFRQKGSFKKTEKFLKKSFGKDYMRILEKYGEAGVDALSKATPVDTGQTASSWSYHIKKTRNYISVVWTNSHVEKGVNIAIILQYGHATRWGGYVQGIDYINPAMRPIFDSLAEHAWKEVMQE